MALETFEQWVADHWLTIVLAWTIGAILSARLKGLVSSIAEAISAFFGWFAQHSHDLYAWTVGQRETILLTIRSAAGQIAQLFLRASKWPARLLTAMQAGRRHIFAEVFADDQHPVYHAAGGVLFTALFIVFAWADASLIANAVQLGDSLANIPWFLTERTLPLLVASVGTSFTLGLLYFDAIGVTHFARWNDHARKIVLWGAPPVFVLALAITLMLNSERIVSSELISEGWRQRLEQWHVLAQWFVIAPMFVTTFALAYGLTVVPVLWGALLWLLEIVARAIVELFSFIGAVCELVGGFVAWIAWMIALFAAFVLQFTSRTASGLSMGVTHSATILLAFLGLVEYPLTLAVSFVGWAVRLLHPDVVQRSERAQEEA